MTTYDISATSDGGANIALTVGNAPYRSARCLINFATRNVVVADVLKLIPIKAGEEVVRCWFRVDLAGTATGKIKVDDNRTGGGALIAVNLVDAAAGTKYEGAGAGLLVQGTTDGHITATGSVVNLLLGKVTVFAVIQKAVPST